MRGASATIILISLFCSFPAERINAAHKAEIDGFPYNAEIAGIRVRYNTVGQLEHRLWPGAAFSRDRPDRAAVWKVKSTGWIVEANDGDYEHKGRNLYGYWVKTPDYTYLRTIKGRVCYVALSPRFLSFNRRIRLGMPKQQVMSILRTMHIPTRGDNDVSWRALNGGWEASFEFEKGRLVAMGMDYS